MTFKVGIPMKVQQSIALVTGASSGIGEATAKRLASAGYKVYGTRGRFLTKVMATADEPSVVADVVLKAASAARPKDAEVS